MSADLRLHVEVLLETLDAPPALICLLLALLVAGLGRTSVLFCARLQVWAHLPQVSRLPALVAKLVLVPALLFLFVRVVTHCASSTVANADSIILLLPRMLLAAVLGTVPVVQLELPLEKAIALG